MKLKLTPVWQDRIFSGVDNFYTEKNLMKFFRGIYDKATFNAYRKVLRIAARDAEKAYRVGLEEGLAGKPKPTTEGLQELVKGSEHTEDLEAIFLFIHSAAVSGHAVGTEKRKLLGR